MLGHTYRQTTDQDVSIKYYIKILKKMKRTAKSNNVYVPQ